MSENNSPFFELINKMFDHISKIEPRVQDMEWKVRIMWWILVAFVGGGITTVSFNLLSEWLKKKFGL